MSTPGPWTAYGRVVRANGRFVAKAEHYPLPDETSTTSDIDGHCWEIEKANARLIAAAPDLLEVCQLLRIAQQQINEPQFREVFERVCALAAIAMKKAEAE